MKFITAVLFVQDRRPKSMYFQNPGDNAVAASLWSQTNYIRLAPNDASHMAYKTIELGAINRE